MLRKAKVKYCFFFRMQELTFKTDKNQNSIILSEDHNEVPHRSRQFIQHLIKHVEISILYLSPA